MKLIHVDVDDAVLLAAGMVHLEYCLRSEGSSLIDLMERYEVRQGRVENLRNLEQLKSVLDQLVSVIKEIE